MNAIRALVAVTTIFAAGYGVFGLVVSNAKNFGRAEQCALSWLFGTGVISLSIWLFGFFLHGLALCGAIFLLGLLLPMVAWRKTRGFCPPARLGRTEHILTWLLVFQVVVIGVLSFTHTLGWDGVFNWEIKARYAFLSGGVLPSAYFQDAGRAFSHQEYPLAIPFSELWIYLCVGDANQFWAKVIFPAFYASGCILLAAVSARLVGKTWVGLLTGMVLFFIPQMSVQTGSAMVGLADLPLSVVYLAAIGYLLICTTGSGGDCFRIYSACLVLLPWTKREGSILWLIAVGCGLLVIWRTKKPVRYLFALLPGLIVMIGWRTFLHHINAIPTSDFFAVNLANFKAHSFRIAPIAHTLTTELLNLSDWSLFWIVIAIAAVYFGRRFSDVRTVVMLFAVVTPIAIYAFIFIFSEWPDYESHIVNSLNRLIMHVAPLACLMLPAVFTALPTFREAFAASKSANEASTCAQQFPERTAGIDFA